VTRHDGSNNGDERFRPGQPVLYRGPHVDDGGAMGPPVICDVKPVVVVEDSPERIALFLPAGTATLMSRPVLATQPKPWGPGEWDLVLGSWDRWNTLFLHVPGEWRATWVMWTPDWQFLGWYVNLQEPLWRTGWGFDIRDLQLDILVAPDRSWRWKDEDDFQRSIDCGVICAEYAANTRASAAEAIEAIESGVAPFDQSRTSWRPDANWRPPVLPDGVALTKLLVWAESDSLGRC
jgi:hypothetical protein